MGTFPGGTSLTKQQYYAKPSNDFWRLVTAALNQNVESLTYNDRVAILKFHRVGLWDIYRSCVRIGSLDSSIRDGELHDFSTLKTIAPRLRLVCFNGKKAAKAEVKVRALGYQTCVLPSSSSANRKNSAERVLFWKSRVGVNAISSNPRIVTSRNKSPRGS